MLSAAFICLSFSCFRSRAAGLLARHTLVFLLSISSLVALAATVTVLAVVLDDSGVRLEWEMSPESEMTGFNLARKSAADPTYTLLSSSGPTGQRRYRYLDHHGYRRLAGPGPFTYRLTVHGGSGKSQTYTAALARTPSAVQRSWSTIKSMFR